MTRFRLFTCLFAAALYAAPATARAAPAPAAAPTPEQIDRSFADGDYAGALRMIGVALAARGDMAALYDRHDLLVLKGETHLRLKNPAAAAAAYDEAARWTKDEKKAAADRVTAELFRRAKGATYTPRAKKGGAERGAIALVDPASRREAFAAMFEDARPRVAAAAKSARWSNELPLVLDAFALLRDLRALELAATGADADSATLAAPLTNRALVLMDRAVRGMADSVRTIEAAAFDEYQDVQVVGGAPRVVRQGQVGLRPGQADLLRRYGDDCERISRIAAGLKSLFPGDHADALRALRDEADTVAERARYVSGFTTDDDSDIASGWSGADDYRRGLARSGPARPGTNFVQRPARRGNPAAGPRGVGTGGPR